MSAADYTRLRSLPLTQLHTLGAHELVRYLESLTPALRSYAVRRLAMH